MKKLGVEKLARTMHPYLAHQGTYFLQRVNKVVGVNSGASGGMKTSIFVRTVHGTLREWLQTEDVKVQQKFKDYTFASACTLNHF